jgi:hypothetical protein
VLSDRSYCLWCNIRHADDGMDDRPLYKLPIKKEQEKEKKET